MSKRKVASLLLASAIAVTLLSGCSKTDTEIVTETKQSPAMEQVALSETQIQPRVYQPYEHVFFQRYYVGELYTEDIKGGQVVVPEGYEILEIEQVTKKAGYGARTGGFDVWFINTKTVEATPVYNEAFGYYDYSEPGTVIEQELEEGRSLTLTP